MRKYTPEVFIGDNTEQNAWVVFTGETDIRWLKVLKSGFRHCFLVLNDGQRWMSVDPLSPYTDIQIYHHIEAKFPLPDWLKARGYKVVQASVNKKHKKEAPWMVCTCVEVIKRILGIHNRFLITPWQLYRHLHKNKKLEKLERSKGDFSWEV